MRYQTVQATEVDKLCAQPDTLILDCRDEHSYRQGHLPGAIRVNDAAINRLMRSDKQQSVLVYCYHGISSRDLATFLGKLGFASVYNLEGGWQSLASM